MNASDNLQQSILQLRQLTGLPIELREQDIRDPEEAVQKIRRLCMTLRDTDHQEHVILRWLTGEIPDDEFYQYAARTHLDSGGIRTLYLIRFGKKLYPEITLVLRSMFPDSRTWILPFDQTQILLACHFQAHEHPFAEETAYKILDLMNTELMEQVCISFSGTVHSSQELTSSCRQCILAMKVGSIFYPDRTIYAYNELGIGQLLYDSPEETLREYVRSHIGERFLTQASPAFNTENQNTANCFFSNDMNIAQTAKQLHVHRNTLLYRLEQIENETGLDIRRFDQAVTYRICSLILLGLK